MLSKTTSNYDMEGVYAYAYVWEHFAFAGPFVFQKKNPAHMNEYNGGYKDHLIGKEQLLSFIRLIITQLC